MAAALVRLWHWERSRRFWLPRELEALRRRRKKNSLTMGAEADPRGGGWRPPWASRSLAVGARDSRGNVRCLGSGPGIREARLRRGVATGGRRGGVLPATRMRRCGLHGSGVLIWVCREDGGGARLLGRSRPGRRGRGGRMDAGGLGFLVAGSRREFIVVNVDESVKVKPPCLFYYLFFPTSLQK
jgi:hypothetical protein